MKQITKKKYIKWVFFRFAIILMIIQGKRKTNHESLHHDKLKTKNVKKLNRFCFWKNVFYSWFGNVPARIFLSQRKISKQFVWCQYTTSKCVRIISLFVIKRIYKWNYYTLDWLQPHYNMIAHSLGHSFAQDMIV